MGSAAVTKNTVRPKPLLGPVLALSLVATLLLFGGCKTDCDKLWDHNTTLRERAGDSKASERAKDQALAGEFQKHCSKFRPDQISCALATETHAAMNACFEPEEK